MFRRRPKLRAVTDYHQVASAEHRPGRIGRLRAWWWGSPAAYLACLTLLSVAALAAVLVVVLPSSGPSAQAAGEGSRPAVPVFVPGSVEPVPEPEGGVAGCKASEAVPISPELVASANFVTTWVHLGAGSVPVSATGGGYATDPVYHCYTRTPEGALYAAAAFMAEYASADAAGRVALIEAVGVREGTYDQMLKSLQDQASRGESVQVTDRELIGYRWTRYQPDNAAVQLIYRITAGDMAYRMAYSSTVTLIWDQDDWKVVTPGPKGMPTVVLRSTETFTPWGADVR